MNGQRCIVDSSQLTFNCFIAQLQQLTRTGIVFRIANFQINNYANITESPFFADRGKYFNKQVTKEFFFANRSYALKSYVSFVFML